MHTSQVVIEKEVLRGRIDIVVILMAIRLYVKKVYKLNIFYYNAYSE